MSRMLRAADAASGAAAVPERRSTDACATGSSRPKLVPRVDVSSTPSQPRCARTMPAAAAGPFGRKERLEQAVAGLGLNAGAVVANRHFHVAARADSVTLVARCLEPHRFGPDRQGASLSFHRIQRVEDQI